MRCTDPAADVKLRNPMTGSLPGCCARAAEQRDEIAPSHAKPSRWCAARELSTAIGRNMERHRHQGFIRFLNAVNAQVPRISTPSSTAQHELFCWTRCIGQGNERLHCG
jgi:hypothetical protein